MTPGEPREDVVVSGARRARRRTAVPAVVLTALAVAAAALAPAVAGSFRSTGTTSPTAGARGAAPAATGSTVSAAALPEPVCPPSTYPTKDPQGYSVQVHAEINDLTILNGWNEQTQNWQSVAKNISAKACGLLKIPSLEVDIVPSGLVFDTSKAIITTLIGDTVLYRPGEVAVDLTPTSTAVTSVSGVAPDGRLELTASTSLRADVKTGPIGVQKFLCSTSPTATLTTRYSLVVPPRRGPATGPVMPRAAGLPALPPWAVEGTPLDGPIVGAKATVVANDFVVPYFSFAKQKSCNNDFTFNPIFGGQSAKGVVYYYDDLVKDEDKTGQPPGASQTIGTLRITAIDEKALQVGPPATVPTVPAPAGG